MARKVNTRFVITLGSALAVVTAGGVGYLGWHMLRNRDPEYLKSEGEAFEKQGDLTKAYTMYHRAVARAAVNHMQGGEELCMKTADMALKLSEQQTDRDAAQQFWRDARGIWQQALVINPRYIPARERILEEDYNLVSSAMAGSAASWNSIQDSSDKLVEMAPTYANAHLYRAYAQYHLLILGAGGSADPTNTLLKIQADLNEAGKLAPNDGRVVSLMASTDFAIAKTLTDRSLTKEADKLRADATEMLQKFLEKNPNNPDASIALYGVLAQQKPDEGLLVLEKAQAANPNNAELVTALASVYAHNQFDKAEKLMKAYLAGNPNATEEYLLLAQLYEKNGKPQDAIAAYQEVLKHPLAGGGVAAFKDSNYRLAAWYSLASLYMGLAEHEDINSENGKADLAQASTYADKYRAGGSRPGPQALLDARLQLIRKNTPLALASLKRADANLGGATPQPGDDQYWIMTKMMLTQVYMQQQSWGLALEQLEMVHLHFPGVAQAEVWRAQMLNQVGQFEKALKVATDLCNAPQLPANLKNAALRAKASALFGMGNRTEADSVMASIDSISATLVLAGSQMGRGQYEEALETLNRVFEKEPDNKLALKLAIAANLHLDRKAVAAKLIDKAVAKYPTDAQLQFTKASLSRKGAATEEEQAELLKSITDDYTRWMSYAQLYHKYKDWDKEFTALQSAEKALGDDTNPQMSEVIQNLFSVSLVQAEAAKDAATKDKYLKVARSYADKAQRLNLDGVNGDLYESELQFHRGDKKGAIATLEKTVAEHPDFARAHTLLGVMYSDEGRVDAAIDQLRQALKAKPDDILALKTVIRLLYDKRDPGSQEEARNDLKQAMLFAPSDPDVMAFADVLGDPAHAIQTREQIYQKDPTNLNNLEHLANLYVQNKQAGKAIELLRPVYDKNPDDIHLADSLARLYRETDPPQINEARTIYERFIGSDDQEKRLEGTLLLGNLFSSLGQNEEAVSTYKTAIQLAPAGDDRGERRLADLYFDTDHMAEAEAMYRKVYDAREAKDMGVLRRIVETQIRQHKYADADQLLKNVVFKQDPNDPEGLVLQGYSDLSQGKSQDALASFNAVLAKDPNNPDALHYRALTQYTIKGDMDQAAKDLMTVRDRNPNAINSRLLLARVYRAAHRLSEAASEYRDVIALKPDLVSARNEYAQFLMELARVQYRLMPDNNDDLAYMIRSINPIETLGTFLKESATRFQKDPTWIVMEGDLLTLVGKQADAHKMYQLAFNASEGSPRAAAAYLESLLRLHSYEEAIDLVNKIGGVRANNVDDYVKRGSAYAAINKQDEAVADFGKALDMAQNDLNLVTAITHQMLASLPPEKANAMLQARVAANPTSNADRLALGQALLSANRPSESAHVLAPLRAIAKPQDKVLVLKNLALAEYEAKDFTSANTDYQELLKIVPDDLESLNNLAFMLADDMKRPADGLVYAMQAAKVLGRGEDSIAFVNNGNVYDTLGWVEYLGGDVEKGIADMRRAIQSQPTPIAYFHLAKASQKAGRKDDALKAVQGGLKLDPTDAQLLALKSELGK